MKNIRNKIKKMGPVAIFSMSCWLDGRPVWPNACPNLLDRLIEKTEYVGRLSEKVRNSYKFEERFVYESISRSQLSYVWCRMRWPEN